MGGDADFSGNASDLLGGLVARDGDIRRNGVLEFEGKRNGLAELLVLEEEVGGLDNVLEQHGNGHGADTSRNRSDDGSDLRSSVEVDVTDKALARLLGSIRDEVGTNVNDDSTLL